MVVINTSHTLSQLGELVMRKVSILAIASIFMVGISGAVLADMEHRMANGNDQQMDQDQYMEHRMHGKHQCRSAQMMNHRGHKMGMFSNLNLSAEQQQKINNLRLQGQTERPMMKREEMGAMHKLIASDSFDEAAVRKQAENRAQAQVERRVSMAKLHNQMYNVLTPEQKIQFNKNQENRAARHKQQPDNRAKNHR